MQLLLEAAPGLATALDGDGNSPLACAARSGCPKIVGLLLAAAPETALQRNKEGLLPLELALVRKVGGWQNGSVYRSGWPCRGSTDRIRTGLALLRQCGAADVLPVLATVEDRLAEPLFVEAVRRWRLLPEQWAQVPVPCPGLAAALPAVLARQDTEGAAQVMRRLREGHREQLQAAAHCLARAQRQLELALPMGVMWNVLAAVWG